MKGAKHRPHGVHIFRIHLKRQQCLLGPGNQIIGFRNEFADKIGVRIFGHIILQRVMLIQKWFFVFW